MSSAVRETRSPGPPSDPAQAAAYWVARRRLGLMTARDETAFEAWRAEPANASAYAEADGVVEDTGAIAAMAEVRRMREAALATRPQTAARRPWRPMAMAAAAAVVAVLAGAVWMGNIGADLPQPAASAGASTPAPKRYATQVGERLNIRLDDGSTVALNTASILEVAYSPQRRDIRLLQGQALFDVAHNTARPFVVTAGDRRVTAVGTAFDVRVDGARVKVVLVRGRVTVDPLRRSGLERLVPLLARETLDPGEQLTAAPDHPVTVATADVDRATSWRNGQVIFRDDTVSAAVAEMNRYSATQLVVDDPRVARLRISGVFGAARSENFLAALTSFYPIVAKQRSPRVTALVWRDDGRPEKNTPAP